MDSPYYGNLHNVDKSFCGPESFPILYSLDQTQLSISRRSRIEATPPVALKEIVAALE